MSESARIGCVVCEGDQCCLGQMKEGRCSCKLQQRCSSKGYSWLFLLVPFLVLAALLLYARQRTPPLVG